MEDNQIYTLAESVDEYLSLRQISKKKYFPSYLISAKFAWRSLFKNTIYATNSQWLTLKKGVPYNYVDMPPNVVRLFSVSTIDDCNNVVNLFYNSQKNILPKPLSSQKKCGCGACDCGGLCEDTNSLVYTTKILFTILGVDYIEKTWLKVCPNGDIIEYKEIPTKKYNDFVGDSGDYMNDYMNDYDIADPPFSDYTIVTEKFQKVICKLQTKVCGCPDDTPENIGLLNTFCGCYLPETSHCKKKTCEVFLGEINNNCQGTVKVSECGNTIYYIPDPIKKVIPEFLLVNWQTSGENCSSVVQVPEYAIETLFSGIDYYSKRYNNSYSSNERLLSKYEWQDAQDKLIAFLNPLSLKWLSTVVDAEIKW